MINLAGLQVDPTRFLLTFRAGTSQNFHAPMAASRFVEGRSGFLRLDCIGSERDVRKSVHVEISIGPDTNHAPRLLGVQLRNSPLTAFSKVDRDLTRDFAFRCLHFRNSHRTSQPFPNSSWISPISAIPRNLVSAGSPFSRSVPLQSPASLLPMAFAFRYASRTSMAPTITRFFQTSQSAFGLFRLAFATVI